MKMEERKYASEPLTLGLEVQSPCRRLPINIRQSQEKPVVVCRTCWRWSDLFGVCWRSCLHNCDTGEAPLTPCADGGALHQRFLGEAPHASPTHLNSAWCGSGGRRLGIWPFVPRSGIVQRGDHTTRRRAPEGETRRPHHDYADHLGEIAGGLLAGV
jgi:hypothetical protein